MLKKIPPKPKDGTLRVVRDFIFTKKTTKDGYYARFRYVYDVQKYKDIDTHLTSSPYPLSSSGWYHVETFAIKDNAEIFVNMLTLKQESAKQEVYTGITENKYSLNTGSLQSSGSSCSQKYEGITTTTIAE